MCIVICTININTIRKVKTMNETRFIDLVNDDSLGIAPKFMFITMNQMATNRRIYGEGNRKGEYKVIFTIQKYLNNYQINTQQMKANLLKLKDSNYINIIDTDNNIYIEIVSDKYLFKNKKESPAQKVEKTPQKAVKTEENRVEGFASPAKDKVKKSGPNIINPVQEGVKSSSDPFWD